MKRIFVALLFITALAAPVFGQETTIIRKDTINSMNIPATMLAWTSNGIFYDEWDILIRSPAELSNYEGYGLYTAYGNLQSWRSAPVGTTVNPFTTTPTFTPGDFYFGATLPLFNFRAGAIMGFDGSLTGNYAGDSLVEYSDAGTITDATGLLNQYAWSESSSYTDFTQNSAIRLGAGIDLGFMGVSLYGEMDASTRKMGGLYRYANTKSTASADPAYVQANDIVTNYSAAIGANSDGSAQGFSADGGWNMNILAEYPLFTWLPLTASLYVGGDGNASSAPAPAELPASISRTIANLAGAPTLTALYKSTRRAGTWNVLEQGTPSAENTYSFTGFTPGAANDAVDIDVYKNSTFIVSGSIMAEPAFKIADRVGFNGIFSTGYTLSASGINNSTIFSEAFTGANGATTNFNMVTASHEYSVADESSEATSTIAVDLGGVFKITAVDERLSFGLGLILSPSFSNTSTTYEDLVTTETWSFIDPTNAVPDQVAVTTTTAAGLLMTDAEAILSQGTKTETIKKVYADKASETTTSMYFLIPVSAQLKLTRKWTLFGGYDIGYSVSSTKDVTAATTTTTTYAVTNAAGTSVYNPTDALAPVKVTSSTTKTPSNTALAGRMGFMLRWTPTDAITVDLAGASVMDALDFDLFGGAGFNAYDFIDWLNMSVSFRL